MNLNYYEEIEKQAGITNAVKNAGNVLTGTYGKKIKKVLDSPAAEGFKNETKERLLSAMQKQKKMTRNARIGTGAGLASGALLAGAKYNSLDPEQKQTVKNKAVRAGKNVVVGATNGKAQELLGYGGLALGTVLSKRKGASLGKALASGGLKGMAAGDLLGAATIPTTQYYRAHKKEFGEAPDAKSMGKLMAANLGPSAALWGTALGAKKIRNKITGSLANSATDLANAGKSYKEVLNLANTQSNTNELLNSNAFKSFKTNSENAAKNIMGSLGALGLAGEVAALPTYFVTPGGLVEKKKRELESSNTLKREEGI